MSLSDAAERIRGIAANEITDGEEDRNGGAKDFCQRRRNMLLSLYLLGYTAFGLLDTFFLGWIAHPQFTESVHQFTI